MNLLIRSPSGKMVDTSGDGGAAKKLGKGACRKL